MMVDPEKQERVQFSNITNNSNERQSLFHLPSAVLVLLLVSCEIGKHISNYSISYYNGGQYPLPQTILVRSLGRGTKKK